MMKKIKMIAVVVCLALGGTYLVACQPKAEAKGADTVKVDSAKADSTKHDTLKVKADTLQKQLKKADTAKVVKPVVKK